MAYVMTETGPRNVAQEDYRGYRLELVTGYSPQGDNWPVHAYAYKVGLDGRLGPREKLDVTGQANHMQEGIDSGLLAAKADIDRRLDT